MAIIPKAPFPNVPNLPGVPQVPRSNLFPAAPPKVVNVAIAAGSLITQLRDSFFAKPQWAIYKAQKKGKTVPVSNNSMTVSAGRYPVVVPDSFGEFSIRSDYQLADYPIEDGGFISADKVNNPYEITVRMYKGGSKAEREEFLKAVQNIEKTLDLYDIYTPEAIYFNVNVTRVEIARRGPQGAYFLGEVDLYFREIRFVSPTYSNTALTTLNASNPSAIAPVNNGVVQAADASTSLRNKVTAIARGPFQ